eukprot:6464427-Alexandrium_andersonii.AAC.1
MSASLVGSEMCIRDSYRSEDPKFAEFVDGGRLLSWYADAGLGVPIKSVSYTHLTLPTICSV